MSFDKQKFINLKIKVLRFDYVNNIFKNKTLVVHSLKKLIFASNYFS